MSYVDYHSIYKGKVLSKIYKRTSILQSSSRMPTISRVRGGLYNYASWIVVFPSSLSDRQKRRLMRLGFSPPLSIYDKSNYGQTCETIK